MGHWSVQKRSGGEESWPSTLQVQHSALVAKNEVFPFFPRETGGGGTRTIIHPSIHPSQLRCRAAEGGRASEWVRLREGGRVRETEWVEWRWGGWGSGWGRVCCRVAMPSRSDFRDPPRVPFVVRYKAPPLYSLAEEREEGGRRRRWRRRRWEGILSFPFLPLTALLAKWLACLLPYRLPRSDRFAIISYCTLPLSNYYLVSTHAGALPRWHHGFGRTSLGLTLTLTLAIMDWETLANASCVSC